MTENDRIAELEPCPFCVGTELVELSKPGEIISDVVCQCCGGSAPESRWNSRPALLSLTAAKEAAEGQLKIVRENFAAESELLRSVGAKLATERAAKEAAEADVEQLTEELNHSLIRAEATEAEAASLRELVFESLYHLRRDAAVEQYHIKATAALAVKGAVSKLCPMCDDGGEVETGDGHVTRCPCQEADPIPPHPRTTQMADDKPETVRVALLPCPFCGGEPHWQEPEVGIDYVGCKECAACASNETIWNTRALLADEAAVERAARAAFETDCMMQDDVVNWGRSTEAEPRGFKTESMVWFSVARAALAAALGGKKA